MGGKTQISAGKTRSAAPDTHHHGSASVHLSHLTQPGSVSRLPGELGGLSNKHQLTLHLIFSPIIFCGWIPGGFKLFGLTAKAGEGALLAGLGGTTSAHRSHLPSPWKHERHFQLFQIFVFQVFFLLVHARLSFIHRDQRRSNTIHSKYHHLNRTDPLWMKTSAKNGKTEHKGC